MDPSYYLTHIVSKFNEIQNTSQVNVNLDVPIYGRYPDIPRVLTLNHPELIEIFARILRPQRYLELGIQFCEVIKRMIDVCPNVYGVDIQSNEHIEKYQNRFKFYNMSTTDFLKDVLRNNPEFNNSENKEFFDMVFIDADHSHSSSLSDFDMVFDYVKDHGFIFLHDTYPISQRWTDPGLCNDCYKTADYIKKNYMDKCEILTIPVNPGLSIVRKCKKHIHWL